MKRRTYILCTGPDHHHMLAVGTHRRLGDAVAAAPPGGPWYVTRIGPDSDAWANDGVRSVAAASDDTARHHGDVKCAAINRNLANQRIRSQP